MPAEPFVFSAPGTERTDRDTPPRGHGCRARGPEAVAAGPQQKSYEQGTGRRRRPAPRTASKTALAEAARPTVRGAARSLPAQREDYFQRVESEVVRLALSIARKILHREAQIDPLLLTGIVRVALESVNDGTQVRLRANPQEIPFWRDYFAAAARHLARARTDRRRVARARLLRAGNRTRQHAASAWKRN